MCPPEPDPSSLRADIINGWPLSRNFKGLTNNIHSYIILNKEITT